MAKKRKRPNRRAGGGAGGCSRSSRREQDPSQFRRGIRSGLKLFSAILEALGKLYTTGGNTSDCERFSSELAAKGELDRLMAEATGGMLVLTVVWDAQVNTVARLRPRRSVDSLWNVLNELVARFDQLRLTRERSAVMGRALALLSVCCANGREETGIEAVRMVVTALEESTEVRDAMLRLHTKAAKGKVRLVQPPRSILDRVHPLTGLLAVVFARIGFLHIYLESSDP